MIEALNCLAHRQLVCSGPRAQADFITALRTQTPEGARIFNFNQDDKNTTNALSIRYDALRPLVYTVRDAGLFIYANRRPSKTGWTSPGRWMLFNCWRIPPKSSSAWCPWRKI